MISGKTDAVYRGLQTIRQNDLAQRARWVSSAKHHFDASQFGVSTRMRRGSVTLPRRPFFPSSASNDVTLIKSRRLEAELIGALSGTRRRLECALRDCHAASRHPGAEPNWLASKWCFA